MARTPEQRHRMSVAMKKMHQQKRARLARTLRAADRETIVTDQLPAPTPPLRQQGRSADERFPFPQYDAVLAEAQAIIAQRNDVGRNAYLDFWDGFPHGLSDLTFEMHRRVARVLGVERTLADGFATDEGDLRQVMRHDLLDLLNYAAFGVMKLDKDATG